MKPTYSHLAIIIFFFLVHLSCRQSDNIWSDSTSKAIQLEITTTLQQYHKDIEENGMLAEIPYIDSTDMFSWNAPGYDGPLGYDTVVTILRQMAPRYSKIEHHWDTLTVLPVTKTRATYIGEVTSIMTDTAGLVGTIRFKEEGTMMKRADGWKLVSGKTIIIR